MKSEKLVIEELSRMKSLFGYERGRVMSEQKVVGSPQNGMLTPTLPFAPNTTLPDVTVTSTLTPRQKNINNAFCFVKGGVIVNPSSTQNGIKWTKYSFDQKVTAAEMAVSQKKCPNSELAVKSAAPAKPAPRKPDPKVMELQKQLVAAGYKLGNTGPNKDGIDGIMGAKTRLAQQQMIQQKGQDALKNLTKQGQDFQNKNSQRIQQTNTPSPTAQSGADAIGDKPTGLGLPNEERDGWYYDAKTKDWYTEPQ